MKKQCFQDLLTINKHVYLYSSMVNIPGRKKGGRTLNYSVCQQHNKKKYLPGEKHITASGHIYKIMWTIHTCFTVKTEHHWVPDHFPISGIIDCIEWTHSAIDHVVVVDVTVWVWVCGRLGSQTWWPEPDWHIWANIEHVLARLHASLPVTTVDTWHSQEVVCDLLAVALQLLSLQSFNVLQGNL